MKKIILSVCLFFLFSGALMSQNEMCKQSLSLFVESARVKNYDAAYDVWKKTYDSCPDMHYAIYAYAGKIMRAKIDKASKEDKKHLLEDLMKVYEKGRECFPEKFTLAFVQQKKALLMSDYKFGDNTRIYETLNVAINDDPNHFDNPKAMYLYFSSLVNLHKEGKKNLQEVFDTYDVVIERIEAIESELRKTESELLDKEDSKSKKKLNIIRKKKQIYAKITGSINAKMGSLADCENLIPLYEKNFPKKKDDAIWLGRASARMDEKGCTGDPMFVQIVEQLHKLNPSADSAYYLGILKSKQGKQNESIKFYNEAVALETDKYKKAKILLKISSKHKIKGHNRLACSYAKKALKLSPSMGKAYLIIAGTYADSANECGKDTFEKRAIYWRAAEVAQKAIDVDPSLKVKAQKAIKSYRGRAPQTSDIFESGLAGKTIKFDCWVGGSVKVPNL